MRLDGSRGLMEGAQLRHRVRGDEASIGSLGIAAKLRQDKLSRDVLARIHALIVETSRKRPLTQIERHIHCMSTTRSRPWLEAGVSRSAYYRRRARQAVAS